MPVWRRSAFSCSMGERMTMNQFVTNRWLSAENVSAQFAILDPPSAALRLYFGCGFASLCVFQINPDWALRPGFLANE